MNTKQLRALLNGLVDDRKIFNNKCKQSRWFKIMYVDQFTAGRVYQLLESMGVFVKIIKPTNFYYNNIRDYPCVHIRVEFIMWDNDQEGK